MSLIVCIHEDRVKHIPGFKLAILSLLRHCPTLSIVASFPHAPATLRTWVKSFAEVEFLDRPDLVDLGWNIKPILLLHCLERGYSNILWMDADIIVNRDFRELFSELDQKTLVVAPEYYWGPRQGGNHRAIAWGLKPGRRLSATVNTGIVRVTAHHAELLKAWKLLLNHPAYLKAQSQPAIDRPLAMVGDQEVLTALLGSEEFSSISLKILQRGVDIAQCAGASGYTPIERFKTFTSPPMFIHAIGGKPWMRSQYLASAMTDGKPLRERLRASYEHLYLELSPYISAARQYQNQLGEEVSWMSAQSIPAQVFRLFFGANPALEGLPIALLDSSARRLRYITGRDRYRFKSTFCLNSSPFDT